MNAALHSYQLKLTTPGGAYLRSMPAYQSMVLIHSGVFMADFRSGVRYFPPIANSTNAHGVALAFLSPRITNPYMFGGLWSALARSSNSSRVFGGPHPFWSNRSLR